MSLTLTYSNKVFRRFTHTEDTEESMRNKTSLGYLNKAYYALYLYSMSKQNYIAETISVVGSLLMRSCISKMSQQAFALCKITEQNWNTENEAGLLRLLVSKQQLNVKISWSYLLIIQRITRMKIGSNKSLRLYVTWSKLIFRGSGERHTVALGWLITSNCLVFCSGHMK